MSLHCKPTGDQDVMGWPVDVPGIHQSTPVIQDGRGEWMGICSVPTYTVKPGRDQDVMGLTADVPGINQSTPGNEGERG